MAKTSNRREESKKASREALIQSALTLFPAQGIDVSLDELCAHAGYSRGVFYVHFKTRDDLLLEVMSRIGERWLDSLFGQDGDADSNEELDLFTMMQRFLHELNHGDYPIKGSGGIRPHQLLEACARSPEIKQKYIELIAESISRLTVNVENSCRKGQIQKQFDAESLATVLLLLAIGAHTAHDLAFPLDYSKATAVLGQMLIGSN